MGMYCICVLDGMEQAARIITSHVITLSVIAYNCLVMQQRW